MGWIRLKTKQVLQFFILFASYPFHNKSLKLERLNPKSPHVKGNISGSP